VLLACAWPTARLFLTSRHGTGGGVTVEMMGEGLTSFAPGLVGYALLAHLSRALYAAGQGRAAATSVCAGWFTVLLGDLVLVSALPGDRAVLALGLGNALGMTTAGLLLLAAVHRHAGREALRGVGGAGMVSLVAACVGGPVGLAVAVLPGKTGPLRAALVGGATATVTVAAFAAAAVLAARRFLPDSEYGALLRQTVDNRLARRSGR
jgi:putative peptidoglycan lipid II flippase